MRDAIIEAGRRVKDGGGRSVSRIETGRGVSPVVGLVLLFALVFVGAAILAVSGMALIDALEAGSEVEHLRMTADEGTHCIETALFSGDSCAVTGVDDVTTDGTMIVTWWDDDPDASNDRERVTIDPLGAVVYEASDHRVVYQAGGQWEVEGSGDATVRKSPDIAYEDGELVLNVVNASASGYDGGDATARSDPTAGNELADELEAAAESGYPNLTIAVESEYHEAWRAHFEDAFDHENATVEHDPDDETVAVTVEHLAEPGVGIDVTEVDADALLPNDGQFVVDATVENVGPDTRSDNVTLEVMGEELGREEVVLDSGESENVSFTQVQDAAFRDALGLQNQDKNDLDRYGEYEFTVATGDAHRTESFFLSYPGTSYYRIEDVSTSVEGDVTTVTAEVTNIGSHDDERDVTISLRLEDEDTIDRLGGGWDGSWPDKIERIRTDPWNESTVEIAFDTTELPAGNYSYTVAIDNPASTCSDGLDNEETCERSGSFTVPTDTGIDCEAGECTVTEPRDVNVSVIGTEISGEWPINVSGGWRKNWGAVTASAVIDDTRYRFLPDGTTEEIPYDDPHHTDPGRSMEDYNLNTFGTQERVYETGTENVTGNVSIEATYWECADGGWEHAGTDTAFGRTYEHYECADFGEPTTVNVAGSATADSGDGFVMTRDADRNVLPDIERGYDRQRNVTEVFRDGTDDVDLEDGELQLGADDFAFMLETTMDLDGLQSQFPDYDWDSVDTDDQDEVNEAAWDVAENYRDDGQGDPNFNDVIGFVQVDGGGEFLDIEDDPVDGFHVDGEAREPTQSGSGPGETQVGSGSVEVETGHIVIS